VANAGGPIDRRGRCGRCLRPTDVDHVGDVGRGRDRSTDVGDVGDVQKKVGLMNAYSTDSEMACKSGWPRITRLRK
jgi:hypothetical protein